MNTHNDAIPSAETLTEWTQRFVRYPSPQTELFEQEPAVQGFIADCVGPLVTELGLPSRRDEMGNLLAQVGTGSPHLLLMAYAMTHPAASMQDPYEGRLVDVDGQACVRGRGVSEQKGALAAALGAVAAASRETGRRGTVTFAVSTAGETGRHDAAESILKALPQPPTATVIVIGTTGAVSLANKGRQDMLVRIEGRAAHSSTPWAGVNALEGLRQVMNKLAEARLDLGEHPKLGKATLTPTFVESAPRATHTVQGSATLTLDRRLLPGQDPGTALAEIAETVALAPPWRVRVEPGPFMYPAEVREDGPLLSAIDAGCEARGLPAPPRFFSHGALDAGFFTERGVEATMWGPGDMGKWHTDEETVAVTDIVAGAAGYHGLIERYLAG